MPDNTLTPLTPRKIEILDLISKGLTNKDICKLLGISSNTVKVHVASIIAILGVANRTEASSLYQRSLNTPTARLASRIGRPAIAVLPIQLIGEDTDELAEGLTQDLITRLSHWRWFPVIARSSSQLYAQSSLEMENAATELGVRYLITGSVRRTNQRARVNVHLIESELNEELWSESFDFDLSDILETQREVAKKIVSHLAPELLEIESIATPWLQTSPYEAWRLTMQGFRHLALRTFDEVTKAHNLFNSAIEKDPLMSLPWIGQVWVHHHHIVEQWTKNKEQTLELLTNAVTKSHELDPRSASTLMVLGLREMLLGDRTEAIAHLERAAYLNPSSTQALGLLGQCYCLSHHPDQCIAAVEDALTLNPLNPNRFAQKGVIALAHFAARRYEEAVAMAVSSIADKPTTITAHMVLVAVNFECNRLVESREWAKKLVTLRPNFKIDDYLNLISPTAETKHINRIKMAFAATG